LIPPRRPWLPYTTVAARRKASALRPQVSLLLQAGTIQLQAVGLIDSGSDVSVMPPSLATSLGLTPSPTAEPLDAMGGDVPAGIARVDVRIALDRGALAMPSVPFRVPLVGDRPRIVVLGRQPLFEEAEIVFQDWAARFAIVPRRHSLWLTDRSTLR